MTDQEQVTAALEKLMPGMGALLTNSPTIAALAYSAIKHHNQAMKAESIGELRGLVAILNIDIMGLLARTEQQQIEMNEMASIIHGLAHRVAGVPEGMCLGQEEQEGGETADHIGAAILADILNGGAEK